jgi:hypothetical protein
MFSCMHVMYCDQIHPCFTLSYSLFMEPFKNNFHGFDSIFIHTYEVL